MLVLLPTDCQRMACLGHVIHFVFLYIFFNKVPNSAGFNPIVGALLFALIQFISVGFASMLLEINLERARMREEIQRAEKKLNTMGELAASVAHEIRNPLTVVKGFLQMMRPNENGSNQRYLAIALDELGRAEAIIGDYLNFFSKPKLERLERFAIADVLGGILLLLGPMASKNSIQLHSRLAADLYLYTDRNQLQQALVNLIKKNAIEASGEGSEIIVSLDEVEERGRIVIKDQGKGMSSEQLSRIGTLFFSTKEVGTGLGTAVAMRIVEAMNGKITYQSIEGIGTEVTVSLPLAK